MGNACKFSSKPPLAEAIVSIEQKSLNVIQNHVEDSMNNQAQSENLNNKKNLAPISEVRTAYEKTNESVFMKDKDMGPSNSSDFEESVPKQFVEVQINHLNKEDSLKNEEKNGENRDVYIYIFNYLFKFKI